MTFGQYAFILQKQWKLILACFLVIGLATFVVSKLITPIYQSTVLVVVTIRSVNNQSDYNSLLASDQLVQTEAQLATSDPVLREVASHNHGLTVEQLTKQVTATTKLNTQLFEIDVQDSSSIQAAAIANDIAATLIKQQLQVTQQQNNRSQQQIQQDLDSTRQQIDDITTQITSLQSQASKQSQIAVLQAQLTGLQQHYTQWQTVLAQLELIQAQNSDLLRIAQPAQPTITPVRPQILLNTLAGFVAGLFIGMLLAVLFEQFDTRVRTPEALTQLLDWPILAIVWRANIAKGEEVINPHGHSANVESYRILRTNIGFSGVDTPLRSIIVTSAIPHEGKSTVAANLAIFMAKAGKNVLLVDADLRRPTMHQKFGISTEQMGLSNAILAFAQPQFPSAPALTRLNTLTPNGFLLEPYIHSVGIPNLRVMPSGPLPPNPPELLDSKVMDRFFSALESCGADMVIVDTPPLLGLSDSSILASKVDGALLVTDITCANKGHLKQTKAILLQAGVRILGCVVNKESKNSKNASYSYYNYYSAAEQTTEGKNTTRNGHVPSVPITPTIPMTPEPQHIQSN